VIPHFKNIEKSKKNQQKPRVKIELVELVKIKYENKCSIKNQSKVISMV